MDIKRWTSNKSDKHKNRNQQKLINLNKRGGKNMSAIVKPINAMVEITETKYIKEVCTSLFKKPSEKTQERNYKALQLLRKARRG